MKTSVPDDLPEWIPYKIVSVEGQLRCLWMYLDGQPFSEPFHFESIQKGMKADLNAKPYRVFSSIEFLIEAATNAAEFVQPDLFIFHVSRCGSTLLTQMLCEDERNIVLSEANILDEILGLPYNLPDQCPENVDQIFKAALLLLGRKRTGKEQHLFVKTDSWHMFFYDSIRSMYPQTPILLLYRTPAEVLRSHRKFAGLQAVANVINPAILGLNKADMDGLYGDPYIAAVLTRFLKQFCTLYVKDPHIAKLNYNTGALGLLQQIQEQTRVEFSPEIVQKMSERSQFHAKKPDEVFNEIQEARDDAALLKDALYWYDQLERMA